MIDAAPEMLLPALAAVLAGAVFGDHCSPISDTTILSSTGAGCNHIDHVATQLPYALISAAIVASIGICHIRHYGFRMDRTSWCHCYSYSIVFCLDDES